ncbi:scarecrow-like protein 9 [Amaranthus tricolor]|uniref:scarecrow-like protein 9 n=1 Tax=Amaranthus tricolor TaxID=29722 RepID=UPI00258866AF|nr:scarecrow-like protein 9 [Amaranthus tricolor]XP_057550131.1 scarecrow-like protein 9 [Amaranthus tricolor]XP_057550132.1 scarecrow-like protein 9 [Amaranthus tricolor]XP_057550133.1 scarecrow-like protein 9 [Amaranthus tricolor]XP_057550134.1 scarecrow-like protein 9 [Amaranthus tricolor]XP_057550136.1 scarecrow-like protein 9 [Amaranthus tricolor]
MDLPPRVQEYLGITNGNNLQAFNDHTFPLCSNNGLVNGLPDLRNELVIMGHDNNINNTGSDISGFNYMFRNDQSATNSNLSSISGVTHEGNLLEDYDFSDSILRFINQILVEEEVEGKGCMLQESLQHQALQDAEKSLYEVIGKSYRPQLDSQANTTCFSPNFNNPECYFSDDYYRCKFGIGESNNLSVDPDWAYGRGGYCAIGYENACTPYQPLVSSSAVNYAINGGLMDSHLTENLPWGLEMSAESRSISQFTKGIEEASKFLPSHSKLLGIAEANGLPERFKESSANPGVNKDEDDIRDENRVRKHSVADNLDTEEERTTKLAAVFDDSNVRSDMFDQVLLHHGGDKNELVASLRTTLQTAATMKTEQSVQSKGSVGGKGRGKKLGGRKEVVDLRTLLSSCAQAVATDDRRTANELLKQIRQHSSPLGDGNQRLAHYFADGLEARLAGTGSQIYKALTSQRTTAADVLKAYLLYLAACPFRKLSNFFSNKSIAKQTKKASKIHIIDFGILYGFQWPTFIQRQSMREGGPPKIKITGIDFPQPGFRPAERVEETGRRLENYAQEFRVPFEYRAIAKRWDAIEPEDFDIDEDEVLIVNCIYRLKNLPDETVSVESSRNIVLKMIRKLNPALFIHGVVNGAYSAPFFVTRFREALFHFSAQFDMLETVVPCEYAERMLIERDLLAREALNVVACEGWERVERPETYKQWKIRTIRAGFTQLPLDSEIKERALMLVHSAYHKDFIIDEDNRWLLLGWKGRVLFALSTWEPK